MSAGVTVISDQGPALVGVRGGVDDRLLSLQSLLPLVVVLKLARLVGEVPPLEDAE